MARSKTSKNVARTRRRRRAAPLPIQKMRVPHDPPSFLQTPPWRRTMQLSYPAPKSGTTISPLVGDFFTDTFNTKAFKTCIIYHVRAWSSAHEDKPATMAISVGSPFGNTVPLLTYDDKGPVGYGAKIGFRLIGSYRVPWSLAASFCSIATDSFPVTVEFSALFL